MLFMKVAAYWITGSSGIMSDAAESIVHVFAVGFAVYSIGFSLLPVDSEHPYGHAKISFFSAGFEGGMIILAAVLIVYDAVKKCIYGAELEHLGIGVLLIILAMVINAVLGFYLVTIGKRQQSLILEANGKHVLTDAWTSIGVVIGIGLVMLTGWRYWDPICAILVASNILYSGFGLIKQSYVGLMDSSDPDVQQKLQGILDIECKKYNVDYHELRNRHMGDSYWVDLHLLFDDDVSIKDAHDIATRIEKKLSEAFDDKAAVITHLEPARDHERAHRTGL
jgi:cation diffusion facilitator family transporter